MRVLLTPRWIVLHVLLLGVVPVMLWLGWWQWRGGLEGHSPQTTGYAFQWWIFAAFAIGLWVRLVRDELRRVHRGPSPDGAHADALHAPGADAHGADAPGADAHGAAPNGAHPDRAVPYVRYRAPVSAPVVQDDSDLGRYNQYLSQLNAQEAQSTGDDA